MQPPVILPAGQQPHSMRNEAISSAAAARGFQQCLSCYSRLVSQEYIALGEPGSINDPDKRPAVRATNDALRRNELKAWS